jgi:2',3'-cyclic-nucleotide 2'-phosphodiesterase (5'-nucleotidase family)
MGPSLRIVCINDVYSLENLPRLATLLRQQREAAPADRTLVTLAGDFVAPSLLSGLDAGRGMVDCLNRLGVTHVSLGNHEDDIATEELHRRIAEFSGTWLSTNVRGFDAKLVPDEVVQLGRVRVGLLGVVMDDHAAYRRPPFGGAVVAPPNQTVIAEAQRLLREERCDVVIPLTHQSIKDDRALAGWPVSPPFPLILGGHEHSVFLEQIGATWLVKAGADAEHAVIADLVWPDEKPIDGPDLPRTTVRLEKVAAYAIDPELRAVVDSHLAKVHELEQATLISLKPGEALSSVGARMRETSLGARVCSAIRDSLGAEGCLVNGGGIRANRDYAQRFSYADLKTELPFDNPIVVARLPGRVVAEALAASRARAPAESGGFLQVDDRMRVEDGTNKLLELAGAPLEDNRDYRIALVRDLFGGMDHQEPLLAFAKAHPERVPPIESGRDIKHVLVHAFSLELWRQLGGFARVDANQDGVVSEEELAAAVARVTEEAPSALAASLVMESLGARDHQLSAAPSEKTRLS